MTQTPTPSRFTRSPNTPAWSVRLTETLNASDWVGAVDVLTHLTPIPEPMVRHVLVKMRSSSENAALKIDALQMMMNDWPGAEWTGHASSMASLLLVQGGVPGNDARRLVLLERLCDGRGPKALMSLWTATQPQDTAAADVVWPHLYAAVHDLEKVEDGIQDFLTDVLNDVPFVSKDAPPQRIVDALRSLPAITTNPQALMCLAAYPHFSYDTLGLIFPAHVADSLITGVDMTELSIYVEYDGLHSQMDTAIKVALMASDTALQDDTTNIPVDWLHRMSAKFTKPDAALLATRVEAAHIGAAVDPKDRPDRRPSAM